MTCTACGHANPERAKFCIECGAPFAARCASCGTELPPNAKFCLECGTAVPGGKGSVGYGVAAADPPLTSTAQSPPLLASSGARKIVTIIFGDLVGSTALHERLDAEAVRQFMERYYAAMRGAVEAHGGRVTQVMGDGVKAVFGAPRVAEDDALRAVRAGVAMQRAFAELAEQQRDRVGKTGLRVAVNTGEVVADEGREIIGDPVNVAARLQEQGKDGDVVIGGTTQRLVAAFVTLDRLGSFALKGRTEQVEAYRVVSLEPPAGATTAAFVGRDSELARLTAVYDSAVAQPAAALAVVVGSPGLGKSRLIDELTQRLRRSATVLSAHCDAAGSATFAPIAAAIRAWLTDRTDQTDPSHQTDIQSAIAAALPAEAADRTRIATGIEALLAGSPASPEETFFVVRRFFAAVATTQPLVLVIDDLHWAEPLLLDLVEHLVQWGSGVPLLVLVGARPELRDARSSLATRGGFVAELITLGGLDAGAAMRLAANVLGAADLPTAVAAKVLATSEGNPLFVGELVRMLVQEGALTKEGERWTTGAGLAALEMPPTIHALLAARIERLRPEERGVLERAAVVGRHFSRSAVVALLGHNGSDLDTRLESLRRSELIEPDSGWFLGDPALRFHHVLIRDAAYRRLLKGTRAELHEKLADWIEARVGDAAEHDETIGWHFEQAHEHLLELGPLDDKGKSLGERAARRLAAAGRRALARDDVPLAASLLGRAIACLDADDPARADLALDWCEALLSAGDVGMAAKAIDELGRFALVTKDHRDGRDNKESASVANAPTSRPLTSNPRLQAWHTCFASQLTVLTAPQELQATANAVATAAEGLAKLGDAAGEAKAHSVHAQALARLGKVGASEAALDKALAAARKAGDRRRANAVLAGAPLAALWGPSPVTRASGRCLDVVRVLRITQGAPAVEAVALSCQGVLEALRGRTDAARRMIASSRKMVEELGIAHRLFEADVFAGRIDLLEGDAAAAERNLRGAYEGLRDLGLGIDAARAGALLARAELAQGKVNEAETSSQESEALAGDDLQAAIAWRGVRAEALAQRGESHAAVELAQSAVAIAAATDALLDHADARLALAAALRAAGRRNEADAEERRAIELWEAKGATLLAERAGRKDRPVPSAPAVETRAASVQPPRRRVRPNAATATGIRWDAAFAAGDTAAMAAQLSESLEYVDHPIGATYGRDGAMVGVEALLRARDPSWRQEPLATLGESLGLTRRRVSASGATAGGRFDVGAYDREDILLIEVTERQQIQRIEIFAADHLSRALVRLFERYAELLPEGRARDRAAQAGRSLAAFAGQTDPDRVAAALAPNFECIDHRNLHPWSARSAEEFVTHFRLQNELATSFAARFDDVLALTVDALVLRQTYVGSARDGGGAFENVFLSLTVFGADGLDTRIELWEPDREAAALARFDEPGARPGAARTAPAPPVRRHIQPNAATAVLARMEAAFAARDLDAVDALLGESMENLDHPTEATYGREGQIESSRRMMRTPGLKFHVEPLATLGDDLCLLRRAVTASGTAGGAFDVGAYEMEHVGIVELDAVGRCHSFETFAGDRLGDAVARLYARYAELIPEGSVRTRAAATAQSVQVVAPGSFDLDRYAEVFSPDVEVVDHRLLGHATSRGPQALLRSMAAAQEVGTQVVSRGHDVLALTADALLLRWLTAGVGRESGGAFEWPFLRLFIFDTDGRVIRYELFDVEGEAEALARFDELIGARSLPLKKGGQEGFIDDSSKQIPLGPPFSNGEVVRRRVRENAATTLGKRYRDAALAGDMSAIEALTARDLTVRHHPTGAVIDRAGGMQRWRILTRAQGLRIRVEQIATLGDSLALGWDTTAFERLSEDGLEFGASESRYIDLFEVDERGLASRVEIFAEDHLGDAVARLYARYAELLPEGPEREHAAVTAQAVRYTLTDWEGSDFTLLFAPNYEDIDHRTVGYGALSVAQAQRLVASFNEVAADLRFRVDDVLVLEPRGFVRKTTALGTWREGGGAFERSVCMLSVFGDDGRVTRQETFDVDRVVEALARFDEVTGIGSLPLKKGEQEGFVDESSDQIPLRPPFAKGEVARVRANAATENLERFGAAIAARDLEALGRTICDDLEVVHHQTGATYARKAFLATWRSLFKAEHMNRRQEPLASLGRSLALAYHWMSLEGFAEAHLAHAGSIEIDEVVLFEIDEEGRTRRFDNFATERLGNAVACLYERHASRLAAGPERDRAAATARAIAAMVAPPDLERYASALARDVDFADHRTVGFASGRGADKLLRGFASLLDLAENVTTRVDEILALEPDAVLLRWMTAGTDRTSGGAFESPFLLLWTFGADGRVARDETFDVDRDAAALARFDELTGDGSLPLKKGGQEGPDPGSSKQIPLSSSFSKGEAGVARHVPANAASALATCFEAAFAGNDTAALEALWSDELQVLDHPNGATYGRKGHLDSIRRLRRARDPHLRFEPLATLGASLFLSRRHIAASGTGGRFDVGDYEREEIVLFQVDEQQRGKHIEVFADDHLGDALARLYGCYAELLPASPARERAAMTARAAAAMLIRSPDHPLEDIMFSDLQVVDHRTVGALSGRDLVSRWRDVSDELMQDQIFRVDDVLALSADALLRRTTQSGTVRASGGAFETSSWALSMFGPDGQQTRFELFGIGHEAEALARFAELTAPLASQPFTNAASATVGPVIDSLAAHDWLRFEQLFAEDFHMSDRRRVVQLELDRGQYVAFTREVADGRTARGESKLLATRGERLALTHSTFVFADADVGPSEIAFLIMQEVDERGRIVRYVRFDLDDLDAAYAEIDRRWEAGEGAAYAAHVGLLAAFGRAVASRNWNPVVALCAPGFIEHDRRGLAVLGTTHGAEAWTQNFGTLIDLAPDTVYRVDHVRSAVHGLWCVGTWCGTREGGRYEIPVNAVLELDEHNKLARADIYEPDQIAQAQARFDELKRPRPTAHFANAATRAVDRGTAALEARDWEGFARLFAPGARHFDRSRMVQLETDAQEWLVAFRQIVEMTSGPPMQTLLATRGERLALFRMLWRGAEGDIGPSEIDWLLILEVDNHGDHLAVVVYDPEDLDAAYAELDARWEAGDGAVHAAMIAARAYRQAWVKRDWNACAALHAPEMICHDHRLLGWGPLHGAPAFIQTQQLLTELAPDVRFRRDHVHLSERKSLSQYLSFGTRDGGAFELPFLRVDELDELGKICRIDIYDLDQLDAAYVRFNGIGAGHETELHPTAPRPREPGRLDVPPNAATRAVDRTIAYLEASDWQALRAQCEPIAFEDRRRLFRTTGDREQFVTDCRFIWESGMRPTRTLLATAADHLQLHHMLWRGGEDGHTSEVETLELFAIDAEGRIAAAVIFDPDDRRSASTELFERYAASGADGAPRAALELARAWNEHDVERMRALLPADFYLDDRRRTGVGRLEGIDRYLASLAAMYELSHDLRTDALYTVSVAPHGRAYVARWSGTNAEGGEFDAVYVCLGVLRGNQPIGLEIFELEDLEVALARFKELGS